jgi:hypothetical protein
MSGESAEPLTRIADTRLYTIARFGLPYPGAPGTRVNDVLEEVCRQ